MSNRKATLTKGDHENMDVFLGYVLEDFKAGEIAEVDRTRWLGQLRR